MLSQEHAAPMGKPFRRFMSTEEIGNRFVDYFSRLGYETIPGSSLLDTSVPMSFVMSAGMVQFERLSDGRRNGDHFVLIQNCFRYFDLEQIGASRTHLSLFRMPGAFDFGPVDKQRTINQIWSLLIREFGFDPKNLVVTYFGGDIIDGQVLGADMDTALAWLNIGVAKEHIFGLPAIHNFWSQTSQAIGQRNSRKRGPNTEVFYDRGLEFACGTACAPGCGCGRYVEFLNTLFITLKIDDETHQLVTLDEPFTEIVVGEERVALLLQGRESVYDIDCIDPLITQVRCFSRPLPVKIDGLDARKFERILVDHLRALLFLIVDGAPPPGRGGRMRLVRILIRELLTSQRMLGISEPGFLHSMFLTAVKIYPQLKHSFRTFMDYVAWEKELFERTIQVGLYDLEIILLKGNGQIQGADVLVLEKKHGLPIDLLRYYLWQKNIRFQEKEYLSINVPPKSFPSHTIGENTRPTMDVKFAKIDIIMGITLENYMACGYQIISGGSLIDDSIPMSFVMSAGYTQVERGSANIPELGHSRIVFIQNCFRHFDLDKIGYSSTHLSFFRMLGAFAFGEAEKLDQIRHAWNLIRNVYKLPPERLWVTYFGGDTIHGHAFAADMVSRDSWIEAGVLPDHLLGQDGTKNFWNQNPLMLEMKTDLKCGPTTEIFFDRGSELSCGQECRPGCNCGRFIEFLNMLFVSWQMKSSAGMIFPLQEPFVETVIGIERVAMVLQHASSIFEIDCMMPLMEVISAASNPSELDQEECGIYKQILADHMRAIMFLAIDGAPAPGKGGRAFLIRRLVRNVILSLELLGIDDPAFLARLMDEIADLHPESQEKFNTTKPIWLAYIRDERLKFEHTLENGFRQVRKLIDNHDVQWVSGRDVVQFEKDLGIPLPMLTRFLLQRKIAFNPQAYEAARELWELENE